MKQVVGVVIPVYKSQPTQIEKVSFLQSVLILKNYPVVLVCPKGLKVTAYVEMVMSEYNKKLLIEEFDSRFFQGIKGYNRLLLSEAFYSRFSIYEYILICQLDVYLFRDELLAWCEKGFDYVGSPWIEIDKKGRITKMGVGNGGLSLRRVEFFLNFFNNKVLKAMANRYRLKAIISKRRDNALMIEEWGKQKRHLFSQNYSYDGGLFWSSVDNNPIGLNSPKKVIKKMLKALKIWKMYKHDNNFLANNYEFNEDVFWSEVLSGTVYEPNKPNPREAARFSFELYPSLMYELNEKKLPFGCHAFAKYEFQTFWNHFIHVTIE